MDRSRIRSAFLRDLADGVGQSSGNPNPNVSAPEAFVITPDSIRSYQIAEMSADKLVVGTIDASLITVKNINASNITTGTMTAISINGGSSFSDALGTFHPVVINASGGVTVNASAAHQNSLLFHNTAVSMPDTFLGNVGNGNVVFAPDQSGAYALTFAILDRNTFTGANGLEIYQGSPSGVTLIELTNGTGSIFYKNGTLSNTVANLPASAASVHPLNIPHGSAPSSPNDGDIWTTTAGMFVRVNGTTKTVTLT